MANYVSENLDFNDDDEKKKLTPRVVYDDLIAAERAYFTILLVINVLILPITAIFTLTWLFERQFNEVGLLVVEISAIAAIGVTVAFTAWNISRFVCAINGIKRGDYIVVTDTIDFVVRDDKLKYRWIKHRYQSRYYYEHAMYLKKMGRVVISLAQTESFAPDDMLYLVVRKKKPKKPVLFYNSKYYELEELNVEI